MSKRLSFAFNFFLIIFFLFSTIHKIYTFLLSLIKLLSVELFCADGNVILWMPNALYVHVFIYRFKTRIFSLSPSIDASNLQTIGMIIGLKGSETKHFFCLAWYMDLRYVLLASHSLYTCVTVQIQNLKKECIEDFLIYEKEILQMCAFVMFSIQPYVAGAYNMILMQFLPFLFNVFQNRICRFSSNNNLIENTNFHFFVNLVCDTKWKSA